MRPGDKRSWRRTCGRLLVLIVIVVALAFNAPVTVRRNARAVSNSDVRVSTLGNSARPHRTRNALLIGDSVMDEAGDKAATMLADRGVRVTLEGSWGSGPMPVRGQLDWVAETRRLLRQARPDVSVIMFYGNYWPPFTPRRDGSIMRVGDADFCLTWGARVASMVDELRAAGSKVIVAESAPGVSVTREVFECERRTIGRKPGVSFESAGSVLTAPGVWTRVGSRPACDGGSDLPLRPDGDIHLMWSGAQRMGGALADAVLAQLGLPVVGAGTQGQAIVGLAADPDGAGYRLVDCAGGVVGFGNIEHGQPPTRPTPDPTVAMVSTTSGHGYWTVTAHGTVTPFGDAQFSGGATIRGEDRIVGMTSTPSGSGYWLATREGHVFGFGDALTYDSSGPQMARAPVVGIAATRTGRGYWLTDRRGDVYSFGDASNYGSLFGRRLDASIEAIAIVPSGHGYWLLGGDGGVFTFGDARYKGSALATLSQRRASGAGTQLQPDGLAVAIAAAPSGDGYWIATRDGGVFAFGAAHDYGSPGGVRIFSSTPPRTVDPNA